MTLREQPSVSSPPHETGADSGFSIGDLVTSQRLGSATPPDINYLFNHLYHRTEVYANESTVLEDLN